MIYHVDWCKTHNSMFVTSGRWCEANEFGDREGSCQDVHALVLIPDE